MTLPPIRSLLLASGVVAGAALGSYGLLQAWHYLYPLTLALGTPDPACNLNRGPCTAVFADGTRVTLDITPRPVPTVKPLRLEVRVEGAPADAAEIDFRSSSMSMGLTRSTLAPAGAGQFAGTTVLPVCTIERMTWQALVRLRRGRDDIGAPFEFETTGAPARPGS